MSSLSAHTQDNTFLGFAVELPKLVSKTVEKKERIGLLYGKDPSYFKVVTTITNNLQSITIFVFIYILFLILHDIS